MLSRPLLAVGALGCLLAACIGTVGAGPPAPAGDDDDSPSDDGASGRGGSPPPSSCGLPAPGPSPLRRLDSDEYVNTVRDLLRDERPLAVVFPPEESRHGFSNQADLLGSSPLLAERHLLAAEELATRAVADLGRLLPCDPGLGDAAACVRRFITTFGRRAFRRPLTPVEIERFEGVYADLARELGVAEGVRGILEAFLQSPSFLYRPELDPGPASADGVMRPGPYEMASRLSYLLWGSMPDDTLLDSAERGKLASDEGLSAEVDRMLRDGRARAHTLRFHRRWLALDRVETTDKDAALFPAWKPELRPHLRRAVELVTDDLLWNGDGTLSQLLTSRAAFLNRPLAVFLGEGTARDDAFVKTTWTSERRMGLLTHPALLAAWSKPNQTSPVDRGRFVRERWLCTPPPPPPANMEIKAPDLDPNLTTRERFSRHAEEPLCANCHRLMDPLGLAFEGFDAVGLERRSEAGRPIDESGELVETDVDGPFDGPRELADRLATSSTVRSCMVTQWFRFAYGRDPEPNDACSVASLEERFAASGDDIRALVVALTRTDAFLYRRLP